MASFVFDNVLKRCFTQEVRLNSGTFYAELVTAEPARNLQTLGDINSLIPTGGNYQRKTLANPDGNQDARLLDLNRVLQVTFADPTWVLLETSDSAPIAGVVVVAGTSSTSWLLSYTARTVGGIETPFTPDGGSLDFDLSSGIISIDYSN